MNPALNTELHHILDHRLLQILFQPILDSAAHSVFGYEALVRGPSNSVLHAPMPLMRAAQEAGRLFELELLCRALAIQRFRELALPGRLFLNVNPSSLLEPDFRTGETLRLLHAVGLSPRRVVIEITEQEPLGDYTVLRTATQHYASAGFRIAIDDLGAGYAGLRLWSEVRPDFVKIDHHFIQNIHTDDVKREFVRSIRDMARRLECRVIAEGIESEDEFTAVRRLGIRLHQGYHLGRPSLVPAPLNPQRFAPPARNTRWQEAAAPGSGHDC
ncbi:MAG: EAL domain-containing protein [Gammaproteobacteria bacterium]